MEDDKYEPIFPLPVWAIVIALVLSPVVWGCAAIKPLMPAAVPEKLVATFSAPHTNGRLYDEPCTNPTIMDGLKAAGIPAAILASVKAATGTYQGEEYGVCWTWNIDESGAVVVWDDATSFVVPRQILQFPLGV